MVKFLIFIFLYLYGIGIPGGRPGIDGMPGGRIPGGIPKIETHIKNSIFLHKISEKLMFEVKMLSKTKDLPMPGGPAPFPPFGGEPAPGGLLLANLITIFQKIN